VEVGCQVVKVLGFCYDPISGIFNKKLFIYMCLRVFSEYYYGR